MGVFGSPIKSIQRGTYSGAGGTVTITGVVVAKSFVMSKSKSSAGYVAVRADVTGSLDFSGYDRIVRARLELYLRWWRNSRLSHPEYLY